MATPPRARDAGGKETEAIVFRYHSAFEVVGRIPRFSQEVIREELAMWGVPGAWVREHGGPVARAFVEALPASWQPLDYRVRCKLNWLRRGWTPGGGGGYHMDL